MKIPRIKIESDYVIHLKIIIILCMCDCDENMQLIFGYITKVDVIVIFRLKHTI